jgi:ribosome-associated toxin RatA of RatAB toxin-antitoxin module
MNQFIQIIQKKGRFLARSLSVIALTPLVIFSFPVAAELPDRGVEQQIAQKQVSLREGQVVLSGSRGQYTGKLLVTATPATVWAVLTDYDNFEKFMPDVRESKLLESSGDKKVFEQVRVVQALIFSRKTLIRLEAEEAYPQNIRFKMTSGDLKSLQGSWTLEYPASRGDNQPTQILITHQISVDPGAKSWRDIFYGIYEDSLERSLQAIEQEIARRSGI